MSLPPSIHQLLPGTQLYKYGLKQKIGGGNFGQVWLADDMAVGREYAIKILKPGTPIDQRLREAQIGNLLTHANLVRVHQADVATHGGQDFVIIAMDYMPRGPVTRLANASHFLELPDVVRLGCDILRGLEYLHAQDFFHNDIKPENVLIGPQAQGMLTDYGIVGISKNGAPVVPPSWYKIHAAPEVVNKQGITAKTDVFQTGLTLYRMLVGLPALRSKFNNVGEGAYYKAVVQGDLITAADFPAYVPGRLRRIVLKAIDPNPANRYGSALEMRRELERLTVGGYWTVEPSGRFVGHSLKHEFRYEQRRTSSGYEVTTFRKNKASGRETRCTEHCASGLNGGQATKQIAKFVKSVVDGK